jgi:1-deoxy-D-xylulose-5-phosphate reductoisomerase
MNGSNEVAVAAFLRGEIKYIDIQRVIMTALERTQFVAMPTIEDYAASNEESRRIAREVVDSLK